MNNFRQNLFQAINNNVNSSLFERNSNASSSSSSTERNNNSSSSIDRMNIPNLSEIQNRLLNPNHVIESPFITMPSFGMSTGSFYSGINPRQSLSPVSPVHQGGNLYYATNPNFQQPDTHPLIALQNMDTFLTNTLNGFFQQAGQTLPEEITNPNFSSSPSRGLPGKLIENISTLVITEEIPKDDTPTSEQHQCCICLEVLVGEAKKLPCGHMYHQDCIYPWLKDHINCPYCRKKAYDESKWGDNIQSDPEVIHFILQQKDAEEVQRQRQDMINNQPTTSNNPPSGILFQNIPSGVSPRVHTSGPSFGRDYLGSSTDDDCDDLNIPRGFAMMEDIQDQGDPFTPLNIYSHTFRRENQPPNPIIIYPPNHPTTTTTTTAPMQRAPNPTIVINPLGLNPSGSSTTTTSTTTTTNNRLPSLPKSISRYL